jgi:hypothetical protein
VPTKKGVTLNVEQFPDLEHAVAALRAALERRGLLAPPAPSPPLEICPERVTHRRDGGRDA